MELKTSWCNKTSRLTKIEMHPYNPRYRLSNDNKMIIEKSSIENEYLYVIVFVARDAENITIPNFIKHIGLF